MYIYLHYFRGPTHTMQLFTVNLEFTFSQESMCFFVLFCLLNLV